MDDLGWISGRPHFQTGRNYYKYSIHIKINNHEHYTFANPAHQRATTDQLNFTYKDELDDCQFPQDELFSEMECV